MVSSRNWPRIEDAMAAATQKVPVCLELNEQSISAAVLKYIDHKVEQLASNKRLTATTREIIQAYLTLNANNTFLWVALVSEQLADPDVFEWHIQTKLDVKEFPPGLDALYDRMLRHVLGSNDANLCSQILAVASIVCRPVDLAELASLTELLEGFPHDKRLPLLEKLIGQCGSLLTIRGGIIYFVHQSAKDFLLGKALSKIMPSGIGHERTLMLSRCLKVMSSTIRRNIYNLDSPGTSVHEIQVPIPDPLMAARYACVYWIDHFSSEEPTGEQQYSRIYNFLTQHYLHWLESLSILRSMSEGIARMSKLMHAVQILPESSQLKRLIRDAVRHMRHHRLGIESAPLQVYCSALIFNPTHSFIRELFRHEEPQWILTKPTVDSEWSACLQTLEGHNDEVKSVVFSPDAARLASASTDGTVKLWDTTTGQCLHTIEGHEVPVMSVDFSCDGAMLASVSGDTVKLWNTMSYECLKALSHKIACFSVFSPDGTQLASSSLFGTIKVWGVTTGHCLRTLSGHGNMIMSIAFSGDGTRLASASTDETVRIWNVTTGSCLAAATDHKGRVTSVAFLGDGTQFASADESTVKIRNSSTGQCLKRLESAFAFSVLTWSRDGVHLASAGRSPVVKLWDARTGYKLRTLGAHGSAISSLAFSGDGTQLASASYDKTIKLWDLTVHQPAEPKTSNLGIPPTSLHPQKPTHKRHLGISDYRGVGVRSLAFSHGGEQLASLSTDGITLWNSKTGRCLQHITTLQYSYIDCCEAIAFCGSRLRAASIVRKSIDIWDVTAYELLRTLQLHDRVKRSNVRVSAMAFSGDGILFALAMADQTVALWDMATGNCTMTFCVPWRVCSLRFSETGSRLQTDIGTIDLGALTKTSTVLSTRLTAENKMFDLRGYTVERKGAWILKDSKKILWLPPENRAVSVLAISLSGVAIVCGGGRLLNLQFGEMN